MIVNDRIYGKVVIKKKVLIELINSAPLQRLKKIYQLGPTPYAYPKLNHSRFEHSLGVMILLQKQGASIEEQIAGLIHDTPHTAFSHVADFLYKNDDHSFHERFYEKVIMKSEIPAILEKHKYNIKRILDHNNFSLLERSAPDMCADRIDYTFRDRAVYFGRKQVKIFLKHMIVHEGEIIFDNAKTALQFSQQYLEMDQILWAGPQEVTRYQIMANIIRQGIDSKKLTEEDLFTDDEELYNKLQSIKNKKIQEKLKLVQKQLAVVEDRNHFDLYCTTKCRYINPKILLENSKTKRVSDFYPQFAKEIEQHQKKAKEGYYIRII